MVRRGEPAITEEVNWASRSHEELYRAVHDDTDPAAAAALAGEWVDLADAIGRSTRQFAEEVRGTESGWQGESADQARRAAAELADWGQDTAATACDVARGIDAQGELAARARALMPEPVLFDWDATIAQGIAVAGPVGFYAALADLSALSARADQAHQQAVEVMTSLEAESRGVDAALPAFDRPPDRLGATDGGVKHAVLVEPSTDPASEPGRTLSPTTPTEASAVGPGGAVAERPVAVGAPAVPTRVGAPPGGAAAQPGGGGGPSGSFSGSLGLGGDPAGNRGTSAAAFGAGDLTAGAGPGSITRPSTGSAPGSAPAFDAQAFAAGLTGGAGPSGVGRSAGAQSSAGTSASGVAGIGSGPSGVGVPATGGLPAGGLGGIGSGPRGTGGLVEPGAGGLGAGGAGIGGSGRTPADLSGIGRGPSGLGSGKPTTGLPATGRAGTGLPGAGRSGAGLAGEPGGVGGGSGLGRSVGGLGAGGAGSGGVGGLGGRGAEGARGFGPTGEGAGAGAGRYQAGGAAGVPDEHAGGARGQGSRQVPPGGAGGAAGGSREGAEDLERKAPSYVEGESLFDDEDDLRLPPPVIGASFKKRATWEAQ
ncbi:PPE domain-containing protein [Actinokineospora bangkokensis]|uniref:PPE family domain-containing protein n=1 Tax=Actinokineospora bangkokensis TaxID=1193682 RepID=A0A1Q9LIF7_9PSEU|nr:PPE domain-containing protein [Actinokineospora bangkokensis]OLR91821.1 hypothetical protein BJP25_23560 [Actinokineospora bangkokensis]